MARANVLSTSPRSGALGEAANSTRQAATRALAGADASAAMLARIHLGSIVAGPTPSAASAFAEAIARLGRPPTLGFAVFEVMTLHEGF
jgi:hypothetical protein